MAATHHQHRVTIWLDTRLALESLIVGRLARYPASRHQDWLRGLLIQGFRAECHSIRLATPQKGLRVTRDIAFAGGLRRAAGGAGVSGQRAPARVLPSGRAMGAGRTEKPFAVLSKVIG